MTFANEGRWDRAVRIVAGGALIGLGWSAGLSGAPGLLALGAGAVALTTGLAGWCPAYTVIGISTRTVAAGHCPACEAGRHS